MSMGYGQARLSSDQLYQLKHLMGAILTLLSVWALFSLDIQSEILLLPAVIVVGILVVKPDLPQLIPDKIWRYVTPILIVIIVSDFLSHAPEFIPSLVRMIVWLLLYRNLAPRGQREDMQLILLCLFCVVLSGVMTVSLLFAFQILLFAPLAMLLLFLICLLDQGKKGASPLSWVGFNWFELLRDLKRVIDYRVLLLCSLLFGFVVSVSTILFILTPRFNLDQAIPFLEMQTQPMTGFSDEVSLGDVTEVSEDTSVAVRVDVPSLESLDAVPYWRMLVLDQYQEGTFRMSSHLRRQLKTVATRELITEKGPHPKQAPELWTFYLEGGISRFLPVPGHYGIMRFQAKQDIQFFDEAKIHGLESVKQSVFSYQLEGLRFSPRIRAGERETRGLSSHSQSAEGRVIYPESTVRLTVSEEDRGHLRQINNEILAGGALSVPDYASAVERHLNTRFKYSLSPDGQVRQQSSSQDPIVNWLLEGSRGHCELFAGAFVLLARDLGVPARMIVGFTGGSWNAVEDYFLLRNSDAHVWVEIYDREQGTWLRTDPTPGANTMSLNLGQSTSFEIETGWDAWIDSLRIQWYRRIVNFEQEDQLALVSGFQKITQNASRWIKEHLENVKAQLQHVFSGAAGLVATSLVAMGGVGLILIAVVLWRYRHGWLEWFLARSRGGRGLSPSRREAGRLISKLAAFEDTDERSRIISELQAVRFGPDVSYESARSIFSGAKRFIRG